MNSLKPTDFKTRKPYSHKDTCTGCYFNENKKWCETEQYKEFADTLKKELGDCKEVENELIYLRKK